MGKTRLIILLCILGGLYACSDSGPTSVDIELQSIEEVKQYLNEAKNSSDLITEVDFGGRNRFYRLTFESGNVVTIQKTLVLTIDQDEAKWIATINFHDSSNFQAPLLGDSLPITDSDIQVNPHHSAPLTALITAEMPVDGFFSVEVKGRGEDGVSISHDFDQYSSSHEIPVLGLYPDYENQVELTFRNRAGDKRVSETFTIQTQQINLSPNIDILTNSLPADDDGIYFLSEMVAGFDQKGDIRWMYSGNAQYVYRKMVNGNLIITSNENIVSYHPKKFMEVTMLGETVKTYEVPNRIHHEIRQIPNGNFLVASNANQFEGNGNDGLTEEGVVFEVDRNSGSIIKEWDFNQILDTSRERPPSGNPDDLLHINAVYYDESDDSIVISSKHQSTIAKVDYESGDIIWLLAHPRGWDEPWQEYVLTPINQDGPIMDLSTVDFYPYFQHAPMRLPNGNILLYDNGNYRNYYDNKPLNQYSRAVEYEIDKEAGTVKKVWEFDYNQQIYTIATGDVDLLDNDNRLIGFNWISDNSPKIVELSPNDEILFEADINRSEVFYYRSEKIRLYSGL